MNEISAILNGIKTTIDIAKILKNSSTTLSDAEQKLKLADLISSLANLKAEMADIQSLLLDKDAKIQELHTALKIKDNIVFEPPYYWIEDSENRDGPFCQICWDTKDRLVRLQSKGTGMWRCESCKKNFTDRDYVPSLKRPRPANDGFPKMPNSRRG